MANFNIVMPKLGESIQEGIITKWFVKEGDRIEEDDVLFEVATDKVDSEIPSPVDGTIKKILYPEESLVAVGEVLAVIATGDSEEDNAEEPDDDNNTQEPAKELSGPENTTEVSRRFYSPLVKTIAKEENISLQELETIHGSGMGGRVQKKDILAYLESKEKTESTREVHGSGITPTITAPEVKIGTEDKEIEMDRVRKLIADHMIMSKKVSPHVTSVVEADVTELVLWRNKNKMKFHEKYGDKITYMPVFTEAVAAALAEYPLVNSSVNGDKIIMKKDINIGIAVAKPDGNLIVPVIKNAEQRNLVGISKELNRLADAARNNKLDPSDIQGGTFTITNFGSFGNIIGTPIINQPQLAILATGVIQKKPAVLETPSGDVIAIRHKMYLSLSYDHRVIDGALGGAFLRRIADILEDFDANRVI